jgi:hypothetical protein
MPSPPAPITFAQRVQRSDDALFQEVGGEGVLLDLSSELYFGLDAVGTRVWVLLGESEQLQSVYEALCEEFDAEPERIGSDLLALVEELSAAGLVSVA